MKEPPRGVWSRTASGVGPAAFADENGPANGSECRERSTNGLEPEPAALRSRVGLRSHRPWTVRPDRQLPSRLLVESDLRPGDADAGTPGREHNCRRFGISAPVGDGPGDRRGPEGD